MFGRKQKAPAAKGNPETADILRDLKGAGIAAGADSHGNLKEEARELMRMALQLEHKAQQATAAKNHDLSTALLRKAQDARQSAQNVMRMSRH